MKVEQIMTPNVKSCRPEDSLQVAARMMWDHDCGIIPVVDERSKLVGVVTDRDICMAAMFRNVALSGLRVLETMSTDVRSCRPHDSIETAEWIMRSHQIHRLPVVDARGGLVGILSLNDIILAAERERRQNVQRRDLPSDSITPTLAAICTHRGSEEVAAASKAYTTIVDESRIEADV